MKKSMFTIDCYFDDKEQEDYHYKVHAELENQGQALAVAHTLAVIQKELMTRLLESAGGQPPKTWVKNRDE